MRLASTHVRPLTRPRARDIRRTLGSNVLFMLIVIACAERQLDVRPYGSEKRTIAFETDDLQSAVSRLQEHGVRLIGGPMPRGDGYEQVFFRDPDGHVLELFEWTDADQSDAPERAPVRS